MLDGYELMLVHTSIPPRLRRGLPGQYACRPAGPEYKIRSALDFCLVRVIFTLDVKLFPGVMGLIFFTKI